MSRPHVLSGCATVGISVSATEIWMRGCVDTERVVSGRVYAGWKLIRRELQASFSYPLGWKGRKRCCMQSSLMFEKICGSSLLQRTTLSALCGLTHNELTQQGRSDFRVVFPGKLTE